MASLKALLDPKSVAIIGASRDKKKLGRLVLDNILKGGFKGKVYPVNPKAEKIAGIKCHHSVKDIKGDVDLALIAIPANFVYEVIKECYEKKVGSVVIISSGFSEVGGEGMREELKIKRLLEDLEINLLGPNCLGIISPFVKLNATFAKGDVSSGNVAFLSQSGALGTAALDWAVECGFGFSHFVSLGNKGGLSENDFIKYFSDSKKVKAIALYLEDFSDGKEFMRLASSSGKPIIVLRPGKSKAAQAALGSHTGSLAQNDVIITAALKQIGVIRVATIEELFNFMKLLSWSDRLDGNRIAIITNAGGPGVITTDAIELNNLKLAKFKNQTIKLLASKLPKASNIRNPVDVLGDALADRFKFALETVVRDKKVDGIIVLLTPQVMTEIEKTAQEISEVFRKNNKLIVASFVGGKEVNLGRKIFAENKVPCFRFPVDAIKAVSYLWQRKQVKSSRIKHKDRKIKVNISKVQNLIKGKKGSLDSQVAEKVLKAYKIPVLESHFPKDIADARRVSQRLKYPVVLKLIHPKLLHKTEVNAVRLNIRDDVELTKAYNGLESMAKKMKLMDPKVEMQHFVKGALELIIGVKFDEDRFKLIDNQPVFRKGGFGHSVLFGMGGIYTEVYKDFALRITPISAGDIEDMIDETKVSEILKGARGVEYNLAKIKEVLEKVNQLVLDFPEIRELDLNPLFAKDKDVWVVDVKMIVDANKNE